MALLLASNNAGKLREVRALLADLRVVSPADLDIDLEVDETGQTFAANAELKARAYAAASGYIALADDSGLEVDALGGTPGVRSARYGAPDLDDEGRYLHLLSKLQSYPEPSQRIARFRCAISAITRASKRSCPRRSQWPRWLWRQVSGGFSGEFCTG